MATHSSVLAWRIPGTGEPGGLPDVYGVAQSWTRLKRLSSSSSVCVVWCVLCVMCVLWCDVCVWCCGCPQGELWLCVCCVFPRSAWEGGGGETGSAKALGILEKTPKTPPLFPCPLHQGTRPREIHLQQSIGRNVFFIRSHTYPCELPLA